MMALIIAEQALRVRRKLDGRARQRDGTIVDGDWYR